MDCRKSQTFFFFFFYTKSHRRLNVDKGRRLSHDLRSVTVTSDERPAQHRSTRTPSPARLLHVFAIWRVLVNSAHCMESGGEGDRVCTELEGSGIVLDCLFVSYCVTRMPFSRGGAWHPPISRSTPANVQLNPLALKTLKSHTSIISVQDVDYTAESPHYCRPQLGFRGGPNSRQVAVPPSWTTFPSSPFLIFM